jgi:hypothetical protein
MRNKPFKVSTPKDLPRLIKELTNNCWLSLNVIIYPLSLNWIVTILSWWIIGLQTPSPTKIFNKKIPSKPAKLWIYTL